MEHQHPHEDTMGLEEGARFLRLGLKAMKELVDSGKVPAVSHNQKHTVMLREALVEHLREEGRKQAAERRVKYLAEQGRAKKPRRAAKAKPTLPDLSAYE